MLRIVTMIYRGAEVLASSKGFEVEHVNKLYRGVERNLTLPHEFVCLADPGLEGFDAGIVVEPLEDDERDYFTKMQAFRPDMRCARSVWIDLDSIIVGNLDDIMSYAGDYALMRDHHVEKDERVPLNSTLVGYTESTASALWSTFQSEPRSYWLETCRYVDRRGNEMHAGQGVFMYRHAPFAPDDFAEMYPGQALEIAEYDRTPDTDRATCRIVYFCARRKPWTYAQHPIVREHWC